MDSVLGLVRHAGNDSLFKAIEMALLATLSGQPLHLHAEGLRGTGKTTIMRAVRRALPRIRRIKQCLYNCDPAQPHCPVHRALTPDEVERLGDEWVPMPFLEISHSAKVGTVVGSINLSKLVSATQPEAALLPGTIPQAHRGIIFVDEINRLAETAPELADVLLDVMGTKPGRVQIEETGLPAVELPVQVTVWAASNPDEDPGPLEEIRRQLSDRFDFVVYTDRPGDSSVVEQILADGGAGWHEPLSPVDQTRAELFRSQLAARLAALRSVQVPKQLRQHIAEIYSRFSVESLRAVQAIQLGMRLAACLDRREEPTAEDLARIVPLALRHRVDQETIKKVTGHLSGLAPRVEAGAASAAAAKPRFPTISFGGAAVGALPRRPGGGAGAAAETAAVEAVAVEPVEPEAEPAEIGVDKLTAGDSQPLRHDWATQYPPRPEPHEIGPNGWFGRTLAGLRRNLGLAVAGDGRRPEGGAALTARGQAAQPALRPARANGAAAGGQPAEATAQPRKQIADPLKVPHLAPSAPARAITALQPHELIKTEEELGRR